MANQIDVQAEREAGTPPPPLRQKPLNPVTAPVTTFSGLWRRGGKARAASVAYLSALILGVGLGVVIGFATDPRWTHKEPYRWAAMGLAIVTVSLVLLGGLLLYLATKDDPKDPSQRGVWVRPRLSYLRSPSSLRSLSSPPVSPSSHVWTRVGLTLLLGCTGLALGAIAFADLDGNRPVPAWISWSLFVIFWGTLIESLYRFIAHRHTRR